MNPDGTRVELYDVVFDPGEANNVAAAHPDVVTALSSAAQRWQWQLPPGPVSVDAGMNDYPWPE